MVVAQVLIRRQTKVPEMDLRAISTDEDVVRLQVSMVDAQVVAPFHGVQNLEEDVLEEGVVPHKDLTVDDRAVKVATGTVVHHEVDELVIFENLVKAHDGGMAGDDLVCDDLATLAFAHQSRAVGLGEDLDSVLLGRCRGRSTFGVVRLLDSKVDNTIGTFAKNPDQQETTSVDGLTFQARSRASRGFH